ncbi:helix-turn-helix domain-containing protein [Peterkaempfera bronchialis]|uniref:PucR family transcriptional regulator n=1 Tax=Peterkaempfera bronchialis TaxID=2126346 RepID=A0A345SXN1_9ACTN|nr:helix-turn-helix domain-containing protein [Peterkaempfera bronchialis]AXI78486.1 PucR family transcriptional regulator [Peterkaempfera bronchialis]
MTKESPPGPTRAEDALALVRLAGRRGAVQAVLEWLGRRTGGAVALVAGDGSVLASSPHRPSDEALAAVRESYRRGMPSGVVGGPGARIVHLVALGREPYLVLDGCESHRHGTLLADAARILGLCRQSEEAERLRRRTELTEARSREAVLHLLMGGGVAVAHRIAGAMGARLPSPVRVYIVECPKRRRPAIAERLARSMGGQAWIVPCPVRFNHLIALAPAGTRPWEQAIVEQVPECRVGASDEVALRETPLGYEQAFHALAVARGVPDRWARFSRNIGLAPLLGPEGAYWAGELLGPCLSYQPARRTDPGAEELLATLGSWLAFGTGASRHLKIHRNTLAARLRLIKALLALDLPASLAAQSAAWLALRLHTGYPRPTGRPADLPTLLAAPAAQTWAHVQLSPLGSATDTVRAWLRADARLPETAADLGISLPGARKRLLRAEERLGRSLLHAPSAKYELWLAMSASGAL